MHHQPERRYAGGATSTTNQSPGTPEERRATAGFHYRPCMRIICAPDSFKESMTATVAAAAMARGVRSVHRDAEVVEVPLSDGGEGFVSALATGLDAEVRHLVVPDALGRDTRADWALAGDLAVIEVAQAVGLERIAPADRAVRQSVSTGVGELIGAALDAGARRIVVGLGGSATNDGGAGMLAALGVRFLGGDGAELSPTPAALARLASVDVSGLDPRLGEVAILAACDVSNPLCGPQGASAVFGPQKGASDDDVGFLDGVLDRLATLTAQALDARNPSTRRPEPQHSAVGAGAAGGLGWALMTVLGATMRPGFEVVAETVGLDGLIAGADLVLTAEGSVDSQTLSGKAPAGVIVVAAAHEVPVVVFGGRVAEDVSDLFGAGVRAVIGITPEGTPLATALEQGPANLEAAVGKAITSITGDATQL